MRLCHKSNPSLVQELHHNHSQQFLFHLEGSVLAQPRGESGFRSLLDNVNQRPAGLRSLGEQSSISVLLIVHSGAFRWRSSLVADLLSQVVLQF